MAQLQFFKVVNTVFKPSILGKKKMSNMYEKLQILAQSVYIHYEPLFLRHHFSALFTS